PATHLAIRDAANGGGTVIGDRTGLTTDSDGGITGFAAGLGAYDNYTADVPVAWSLTGVTGTVPTNAASSAVDFATPGVGLLHATDATRGPAATGSLTVAAGRAATLSVVPPTKTLSADAAPFTF